MATRSKVLAAIGREIRRRRTALKRSLAELSAAAKIAPNFLGGIEYGRRNPSVLVLLRICDALDVHPGDIFGGFDALSSEGIEAGRIVDALPDPVRKAALTLLRSLGGDP